MPVWELDLENGRFPGRVGRVGAAVAGVKLWVLRLPPSVWSYGAARRLKGGVKTVSKSIKGWTGTASNSPELGKHESKGPKKLTDLAVMAFDAAFGTTE